MNPKQTYLAWVRSTHPSLYWRAVANVFSSRSGMGGLGDDLTDSISPDFSVVTTPSDIGLTQEASDAINAATITAQTQTNTDWFGQLANAITQLAPTVVNTQAAENLLAINSQRARQGLPLYTQNGQLVTSQMLSPTSSSVAAMEAALSGSSSLVLPILLVGGVILAASIGARSRTS